MHPVPDGAVKEGCKGFLFWVCFCWLAIGSAKAHKKNKKKKKKNFSPGYRPSLLNITIAISATIITTIFLPLSLYAHASTSTHPSRTQDCQAHAPTYTCTIYSHND